MSARIGHGQVYTQTRFIDKTTSGACVLFLRSIPIEVRVRTITSSLIAIASAISVLGCQQQPDVVYRWSELAAAEKQVQIRKTKWQRAVSMQPMDPGLIQLGIIPENPVLRFGIGVEEGTSRSIRVRVLAGGESISAYTLNPSYVWRNVLVHDFPHWAVGKDCALAIESDESFHLGQVELHARSENSTNLLIVSIDTLRQDHLGVYGYDRDTSSTIDTFSKDALLFTQVTPQSSWTRASVASLFTGTYPIIHQARDQPDTMREGLPTLAGAMNKAGYATRAIVGNENITPYWGIGKQFQQFDTVPPGDDETLFDDAIASLDDVQTHPWFLYLHAMGPHSPYAPPGTLYEYYQPSDTKKSIKEVNALVEKNRGSEAVERIAQLLGFTNDIYGAKGKPVSEGSQRDVAFLKKLSIDLYDAEIRNTDAHLGRLFSAMKEKHLYDDTLIIVLSDHGEEFWEHGKPFHGLTLYEDQLDVPFLMKLPNNEGGGRRVDALLEQAAVAPTVLDLLAVDGGDDFPRKSFRDVLDPEQFSHGPVYSSILNTVQDVHWYSIKSGHHKYLFHAPSETGHWFDLSKDHLEQHPLDHPPERAEVLTTRLHDLRKRGAPGLYMLFVSLVEEERVFTGSIQSEEPHSAELRYASQKTQVSHGENRTDFTIDMSPVAERKFYQQQIHALLWVSTEPSADISFDIHMNGEPIQRERIHVMDGISAPPLDGTPLRPITFLANPDLFEPTRLPFRSGVYVWYIPTSKMIDASELDEELRKQLESLGYLE